MREAEGVPLARDILREADEVVRRVQHAESRVPTIPLDSCEHIQKRIKAHSTLFFFQGELWLFSSSSALLLLQVHQ